MSAPEQLPLPFIDEQTGEVGEPGYPLEVEHLRHFVCGHWTADPAITTCPACPREEL